MSKSETTHHAGCGLREYTEDGCTCGVDAPADADETSNPVSQMTACECCGAPATRLTADGVPLCEGDYAHLAEWAP